MSKKWIQDKQRARAAETMRLKVEALQKAMNSKVQKEVSKADANS